MTRDEKYAELNAYYAAVSFIRLEIDALKKDQALLGAPDSALDDALMICSVLAGSMFGEPPKSAQELTQKINEFSSVLGAQKLGGVREGMPPFSMRRSGFKRPFDR
jgi:hypothetical protein